MKKLGLWGGLAAVCSFSVLACDDLPGRRLVIPTGDGASFIALGVGVGADCSSESCRPGLACVSDICEPDGSLEQGDFCAIGPECGDGLVCFALTCQPAGDGEAGDGCEGDLDCEAGLRCSLNGFSTECAPAGSGDIGGECSAQNDCFQGLYCADGECALPEAPYGVPAWEGVSCSEPDDNNVEALFEVPGAKSVDPDGDFFQLPYPNDIRLTAGGRPDLEGFPTPGPGIVGVDIVEKYVTALEEKAQGWSNNPTVIFRFSGAVSWDSLAPADKPKPFSVVKLTDLPADASTRSGSYSTAYSAGGSPTNYVCDDWVALRLPRDTLEPEQTYAVWVTTDARSESGEMIARSSHFEAMLADTPPSGDEALAQAYEAYEPLRNYIAFYEGSEYEVDPDTLLNAVVFTTGDANAEMRALALAVEAADAPTASDWVKCGNGKESPCAQAEAAEGRACGEGTDDYDEYQALVSLPIFQEGEAPYLKSGGGISDSPVRREDVCVSLSVPKSAAPATGWPLVIYGHGTGGSYRGPLRDSVAGRLARETTPTVSLGFDQVQHGPRRGKGEGADQEPDNLFFNFANPDAARGNPLQGAADVLSMVRFAKSGTLVSSADSGGDAIEVDASKIVLFGHSQGSTHGSMALPFSGLVGGVLSGNGGGLAEALVNKTNPVNIAGAMPLVLQDADGNGNLHMGDKHPVLSLLQHYIDSADPLNFAALLAERPEPGVAPKSVLQTFGLDDTYSPPATLARYVYAAGAASMAVAPLPSGVSPGGKNQLTAPWTPAEMPVSGNVVTDTDTATLVCRQYQPKSGSDGHFVVHDVPEANDDAIGFLSSLIAGQQPTVPVAQP